MATLTFIKAPNYHLGKRYEFRGDRIVKIGEPRVSRFNYLFHDVDSFDSFTAVLMEAGKHPSVCLIRAAPSRWFPRDGKPVLRRLVTKEGWTTEDGSGTMIPDSVMRAHNKKLEEAGNPPVAPNVYWLATLEDQPTPWVMIDCDGIDSPDGATWILDPEGTAEWIRDNHLPPCFQGASLFWQITGGAHDPSKPDGNRAEIRMRLGVWLDRGLTEGELKGLFAGCPVDDCTFTVIQPIYTAPPKFARGITDPVPRRSGILEGEFSTVEVPRDLQPLRRARKPGKGGGSVRRVVQGAPAGTGLVDPLPEPFLEALDRVGDGAGECRTRLGNAAYVYGLWVGVERTDIDALAERLAEEGRKHRTAADVDGYGLASLVHYRLGSLPDHPDYDPFGEPGAANDDAAPEVEKTGSDSDPVSDEAEDRVGPAPEPEPEPTVEASPEDASQRLFEALDGAIVRALKFRKEHIEKSGHANTVIKVTAGTGKTSVALDILATRAKGITGHYYAPTHTLAEEVAEKAQDRGIDAVVIKGRSRQIGDDQFMCKKHKLAEIVARSGMKVWPSLCESEDRGNKYDLPPKCEFFDTCDYIEQFKEENVEGRLLVMAHEWLRLDKSRLGTAQFSIVDERFYDSMIRGGNFCLDRITRIIDPFALASAMTARKKVERRKRKGVEDDGPEFKPNLEEHAATARKVRTAIEAGEHPRDHGATLEELERAQKTEALFVPDVWIAPAMPRYQQQALAEEVAKGAEARMLSWLYETLIESYEWDRLTQQVHLVRDCIRWKGDEMADRVFIRSTSPVRLSKHAAAVVIDASANLDILKRLMVVTDWHEINAPIQARVVQVSDTECSRGKLLKRGASSKKTVARIIAFAKKKAAEGNKVLVVCYKDVIDVLAYTEGVDTLHFGKLRGVDSFKGHDVVIIAGRHQTDAKNVENQARAIFGGGSANKLDLPGNYVEARIPYKTRGPVAQMPARVHVHPDPCVQALVEQGREQETMQAVARLRLVHRDRPATVYLLSNMPTDLVVDEFVGWNALLPDKVDEAAAESGGVELLTASELHRVYPEKWPSKEAAKKYLQRRKQGTKPYVDSNREMSPVSPRLVTYRTAAGGTRGPAARALIPADMTFHEGIDALTAVVGALTSFIDDPRHHEPEEDDVCEQAPPRRAAVF